jgi:hypothetical protein
MSVPFVLKMLYECHCFFEKFCYAPFSLNADCRVYDGLQIVILDTDWSLGRDKVTRNIFGQDARSRALRPCSQACQPSNSCPSWGRRALTGCSNCMSALPKVNAVG